MCRVVVSEHLVSGLRHMAPTSLAPYDVRSTAVYRTCRNSRYVVGVGICHFYVWCPNLHFLTSDVSLSPCGHIEPNPAHGRWRVDSS